MPSRRWHLPRLLAHFRNQKGDADMIRRCIHMPIVWNNICLNIFKIGTEIALAAPGDHTNESGCLRTSLRQVTEACRSVAINMHTSSVSTASYLFPFTLSRNLRCLLTTSKRFQRSVRIKEQFS